MRRAEPASVWPVTRACCRKALRPKELRNLLPEKVSGHLARDSPARVAATGRGHTSAGLHPEMIPAEEAGLPPPGHVAM